jgi:hypothetical protein
MSVTESHWGAASPTERRRDCPECGARDAVHGEFCDVCFAELDEGVRSPIASELDEFQFAGHGG